MKNIRSYYTDYNDLIGRIGEDKILKRYEFIYEEMKGFISRLGAGDKLFINERLLMHTVLEYFEDIDKLKEAHGMRHTNEPKVHAYTSYWLLRRKPIQLKTSDDESENLVFANEKFILTYLMHYLIGDRENEYIDENRLDYYKAFINSLFYTLKFRRIDPQSIELMLVAFKTGQAFP